MKPWTTWLARLGIAGACFLVTGCGGSDVPDASSDGQAATDGGGAAAGGGPKVAEGDQGAKADEASTDAPAPAPGGEGPAAAPKPQQGQGNSTADMLAMATTPGGGSSPPAGGSTPAPGNTPGTPGTPGGPGSATRPGGPGGAGPMPGTGGGQPGGPGMGAGAPQMGPGAPGMRGPDMKAMMGKMGMGAGMAPGAPAGGMPGAAGAGAANVDNGPADFGTARGAVRAFLNALKAKDQDRLNEATALRAQLEATTKNQPIFKKIFDLALSDSELDDLAKKLEGYQISGEHQGKSTGRIVVVLRKAGQNGGYFQRSVTVRHEKKGWGVLDITGAEEFKSMSVRPRNRQQGGR
jgi:hypothetical protein